MSDDAEQVWLIPPDLSDMAPLPALRRNGDLFVYSRFLGEFPDEADPLADLNFHSRHGTFEECRAAMIKVYAELLDAHRQTCRDYAAAIQHLKTIPTQQFPNVIREAREAEQVEEQAEKPVEGQAEGQKQNRQEAVTQAVRRPVRRANGK